NDVFSDTPEWIDWQACVLMTVPRGLPIRNSTRQRDGSRLTFMRDRGKRQKTLDRSRAAGSSGRRLHARGGRGRIGYEPEEQFSARRHVRSITHGAQPSRAGEAIGRGAGFEHRLLEGK